MTARRPMGTGRLCPELELTERAAVLEPGDPPHPASSSASEPRPRSYRPPALAHNVSPSQATGPGFAGNPGSPGQQEVRR